MLSCSAVKAKQGRSSVVVVAQLVESRIVIPVVVGSSPIVHPTEFVVKTKGYKFRLVALLLYGSGNRRFM
jgi:hypothetical protein